MASDREMVFEGKHLVFQRAEGRWEFVSRKVAHGVVGVVAVDAGGRMILVEQWRAPVGCKVIELPAGLAGDDAEVDGEESLLTAAQRELLEETGSEAAEWRMLGAGCSSAGLTDELVTLFLATGLRQIQEREHYGVGEERIRVHRVGVSGLQGFLEQKATEGCLVDFKVYAGAFLARSHFGDLARQA